MWQLSGFHLYKQYVNVTLSTCFSVLFCFVLAKPYHKYHSKHTDPFLWGKESLKQTGFNTLWNEQTQLQMGLRWEHWVAFWHYRTWTAKPVFSESLTPCIKIEEICLPYKLMGTKMNGTPR